MMQRILLATDLSPDSETAWGLARTLARQAWSKEIFVAYAVPAPPAYSEFDSASVLRRVYEEECQQLSDALKRYTAACVADGLTIRPSMIAEPLAEAIAQTARRERIDLIVLGIRYADAIDRVLGVLGRSLVGQVARAAPCHVLIAKPSR
jgi:nucleotide-binding universal stress UspA family protein